MSVTERDVPLKELEADRQVADKTLTGLIELVAADLPRYSREFDSFDIPASLPVHKRLATLSDDDLDGLEERISCREESACHAIFSRRGAERAAALIRLATLDIISDALETERARRRH